MPTRWFAAGFLLLSLGAATFAADPDAIQGPATATPSREIPILAPTSPDSAGHFQVTINPLVIQRAPDVTGALADSANEYLDFGWRYPLFSMFSIGYDTGINAFRQDQTIWDDEEATSQASTSLLNKGSLVLQSGSYVSLTGYVQAQRGYTDGLPGFSDATKYGADIAFTPVKDVTTVKVGTSTQQTYNFDHSLLDEDLSTTAIDQKLPWIPLTLHTAGSVTEDSEPLLPADDKDSVIVDASLLWKVMSSTALSGGVQRQDSTITAATVQLATTDTYFTQVSLQTSPTIMVTLRAAHEATDTTADRELLSNSSDLLLTFGLTWNLGDRFNLGAGLNYRTLQSQTPAPVINAPPATVSISAGGHF